MSSAQRPWRYRRPRPGRSRARRYAEYGLTFVILIALAVLTTRFDMLNTRTLEGAAIVNDGDSLTLGSERIRLRGIDAPEYGQTCERAGQTYSCGREARLSLQVLARSGPLKCEGWERDRFDRLLAVCTAGAIELNRRQVENGWAVSYGGYHDAEQQARAARRGIWAGDFERPRDYRDRKGQMLDETHGGLQSVWNWLRQSFGW